MTDTATATPREPDGAPRIGSLDILRGIAILGILFMNINDMGASMNASFGDVRHIGWTTADQVAWWLREVFASGTARCMLEMLFGVGMVILTDRFATTAERWAVMRRYYVRNIVLFLFGLVHIFILLWPGDILHTYGIAALIAFLFRRLKPGWLLAIGMILAVMQLGGGGYGYVAQPLNKAKVEALQAKQTAGQKLTKDEQKTLSDSAKRKTERAKREAEEKKDVAAEDKARAASTGTFLTWAAAQWRSIIELEKRFLEIAWIWEAAGTMLIGAALFKWGVIQGDRPRSFYLGTMIAAYGFGVSVRALGAFDSMRFDDVHSIIWPMGELTRLATTLGHICLVYVLLGSAWGTKLLKPFEAAGRTALTIYICQTLICLWVLYPPWGLALYGKQGWMALMLTALAVNAVLLWAANVYIRHYRIAPVEWAWRSLIEWRRLPMRKGTRIDRPRGEPLPA